MNKLNQQWFWSYYNQTANLVDHALTDTFYDEKSIVLNVSTPNIPTTINLKDVITIDQRTMPKQSKKKIPEYDFIKVSLKNGCFYRLRPNVPWKKCKKIIGEENVLKLFQNLLNTFDGKEKELEEQRKGDAELAAQKKGEKEALKKAEDERILLQKFKKVMSFSQRITQAQAAEMLGIKQSELTQKLFHWSDILSFKIDNDLIIVEDLQEFTKMLDAQFSNWEEKEQLKDGKI